jgi:hypothetical protein
MLGMGAAPSVARRDGKRTALLRSLGRRLLGDDDGREAAREPGSWGEKSSMAAALSFHRPEELEVVGDQRSTCVDLGGGQNPSFGKGKKNKRNGTVAIV